MKNKIKIFGIIVLIAVIGFSFAACGGGDDDDFDTPLNGTWERSRFKVTVSGSKGVISDYDPSTLTEVGKSVFAKGYYKIGTKMWLDLTTNDNVTWSGKYLGYSYVSNEATGTMEFDCTFTLDTSNPSNSKLTVVYITPKNSITEYWYRY